MSRRVSSTEPEFVQDTPDLAHKRVQRARASRIEAKAQELLENDPEVSTMAEARKKARELDELDAQVHKGTLDPNTGGPTRQGRKLQRARRHSTPSTGKAPHRSSRPTRGGSVVRRTTRTVVAPFGSAASAGWTLITGGLSLVLLYAALRDAGVVSDFVDGITGGVRRIADPYTALLPTKGEASPPPPKRRVVHNKGRNRP